MQCGCPECGTLMGKAERGFDSACVCPTCGFQCSLCIGKKNSAEPKMKPHTGREDWEALARERGLDE